MLGLLRSLPAVVVPVVIYNLIALASGNDPSAIQNRLSSPIGHITMPSTGVSWGILTSDLMMVIGLVTLFFDVIASSRSSNDVLVKHVLNMLLFVGCLIEFLLLAPFVTSTFFLLIILSLMATVSGFVISTVSARKDIAFAS
jgi:membrane-associated HD superfamily phosphohydrolase